jgi:hypothetical protein
MAQGLNWEGQTGALLTPFAYTAASPSAKLGHPQVAFHYLNSGPVIGNNYQLSLTEGAFKIFEIGYTAAFSSSGDVGTGTLGVLGDSSTETGVPSFLFGNSFSEFHGKLTIVPENAAKTKWVPAIAVGAIGRFGCERITHYTIPGPPGSTNSNGDFYIVATKTVTQVKGLPFLVNFGEKVTNASVFGVAGNAGTGVGDLQQNWQGRLFGAVAFVVKGPKASTLIFGSEVVQQPHYVQGLPKAATVPTSESYFVRIVPKVKGSPLQIDLGIAELAGKVVNLPASAGVVDLQARAQFGMGITYSFN